MYGWLSLTVMICFRQ